MSLATGARTRLPREVLVKGFDAFDAGAKPFFTAENFLPVEQAAERVLQCA